MPLFAEMCTGIARLFVRLYEYLKSFLGNDSSNSYQPIEQDTTPILERVGQIKTSQKPAEESQEIIELAKSFRESVQPQIKTIITHETTGELSPTKNINVEELISFNEKPSSDISDFKSSTDFEPMKILKSQTEMDTSKQNLFALDSRSDHIGSSQGINASSETLETTDSRESIEYIPPIPKEPKTSKISSEDLHQPPEIEKKNDVDTKQQENVPIPTDGQELEEKKEIEEKIDVEREQPKNVIISRTASTKISGLAGKLQNINLARAFSPGGPPMGFKTKRANTFATGPRVHTPEMEEPKQKENPSSALLTGTTLSRPKSFHGKKRPPSALFLKKSLTKEDDIVDIESPISPEAIAEQISPALAPIEQEQEPDTEMPENLHPESTTNDENKVSDFMPQPQNQFVMEQPVLSGEEFFSAEEVSKHQKDSSVPFTRESSHMD